MDGAHRVPDTPPTRRPKNTAHREKDERPASSAVLVPGSDDYIFDHDDEGHETVATIPLQADRPQASEGGVGGITQPTQPLFTMYTQQQQRLTQPTQVLERQPAASTSAAATAATQDQGPGVQVASSSPPAAAEKHRSDSNYNYNDSNNKSNNNTTTGASARGGPLRQGVLAHSMAPSGTRFRPPPPQQQQQQQQVAPGSRSGNKFSADDDGPTYRGGSSSDEADVQRGGDIKPSTFTRLPHKDRSGEKERVAESPVSAQRSGNSAFQEIMSSAFYKGGGGGSAAEKRKAEVTAAREPALKKPRNDGDGATDNNNSNTNNPATTRHGAFLSSIGDYRLRENVRRLLLVFPKKSPEVCYEALTSNRGSYDRAVNYLGDMEEEKDKGKQEDEAKEQSSEDELSLDRKQFGVSALQSQSQSQQPPAKQQIKARSRIQDKWTASQKPPDKKDDVDVSAPKRRLIRGQRSRPPSPVPASSESKKKPAGKLIRGRKPNSRSRSRSRSESPVLEVIDPDSSDSEADAQAQSDGEHTLEDRVLRFFNDCAVEDLADIAEISLDQANVLVSHRPFRSLAAVRAVTNEATTTTSEKSGRGRRSTKKTFGDKVAEKCLDMWTGYEAVDALVTQCESLGRPVADEMKKWGVDVFGKTQGELECVSLKNSDDNQGPPRPPHDSGIGTPTSNRSSSEEVATRNSNSHNKTTTTSSSSPSSFISQPSIMSESVTLKDFQVVGLNWLSLLFEQNLSCILADDMGLGKTCQVISFLAHLLEKDITGPHLVVVPSSTLENWLREFSVFCPKLQVMPYYADQATRARIREEIEHNRANINVVITTYTIAKAKVDSGFLRSMNFCACVYDEGHMLKSSKSQLYGQLIRIPARFRLLLTGTPLQNNLQELVSLLGFILPSVFKERKDDLESIFRAKAKTVDDTHAALLSAQRIARAKSMLTPFVLRRKKHQVIELPPKVTRVEYCTMNETQREIYQQQVDAVKQLIAEREAERAAGKRKWNSGNQSSNILMKLRQAAIHPLFYRRLYDDETLSRMARACLGYELWAQSDPDQIFAELREYNDFECHSLCVRNPGGLSRFVLSNDEWMHSGKVDQLRGLLEQFTAQGDRILVFSQFTMVMDMLECVLETLRLRFYRLDGTTSVEDRQPTLDAFHENTDVPVFLLSTKAGGAGINLACANKVIIFDSSFNPQEDVQAENRAHRVGQTREVEIVRLVTRETIEEQIHALGQTKLALDQRVAGDEEGGRNSKKQEEEGLRAVEGMVFGGEREQ